MQAPHPTKRSSISSSALAAQVHPTPFHLFEARPHQTSQQQAVFLRNPSEPYRLELRGPSFVAPLAPSDLRAARRRTFADFDFRCWIRACVTLSHRPGLATGCFGQDPMSQMGPLQSLALLQSSHSPLASTDAVHVRLRPPRTHSNRQQGRTSFERAAQSAPRRSGPI
jgi:hypothetical protein